MSLRSRRSICDRQSVYVDGRAGQTHAFTLLKPTLAYRLNMSLCFLRSAIALSLLPWAAVQPALAWGVEGHRIINFFLCPTLPLILMIYSAASLRGFPCSTDLGCISGYLWRACCPRFRWQGKPLTQQSSVM